MHSWPHYGVKTFEFERATLTLDFKKYPFWDTLYSCTTDVPQVRIYLT